LNNGPGLAILAGGAAVVGEAESADRTAIGSAVQLRGFRGSDAKEAPVWVDPDDHKRDALSGDFGRLCDRIGRRFDPAGETAPRVAAAFHSIRSERQRRERLDFDLLFRWFVGLGIDDPV
jgi:hypothetical protein